MPGITGQATTYNAPNYVGELFHLSPQDTPVLSAIGGLTGGKQASGTTETEWQADDLRDAEDRQRLEGADAPEAEERTRFNLGNVLEIHQESVNVSYTKLAAVNQFSGANIAGTNPVANEEAYQIERQIRTVALDVEHSFINGKYHKPDDNTRARRTRGLVEAIRAGVNGVSNVINLGTLIEDCAATAADGRFAKAAHGLSNGDQVEVIDGAAVGFPGRAVYWVVGSASGTFQLAAARGGAVIRPSRDASLDVVKLAAVAGENVIDLCQLVWDNGGLRESETATLIAGSSQKRMLTREFITRMGYTEQTRNVGGVNVTTIETDFGQLNIMLSRIVPRHKLVVASLDQCAPVFLPIPGMGHFFVKPLGDRGASKQSQLYGEIGLEYGNPIAHGLLEGLVVNN